MNTNPAADARAGVAANFASIYLIWGTTYLAIAFVIQTIPPFIAGGIRYGVGALVFGSIIALSSYLWLLTRVPSQKVTTYALVNPIVALILGAVVLHERITFTAMIAASLVLIGVALVMFPQRSKQKAPPRRSESASACARIS